MNIFSWKTLLILIGIYLAIRLLNFRRYLKKFLIPYEVEIVQNEIENRIQHLRFVVRFGSGFFKRRYFTTIGEMENENPIDLMDLKKLLTLTEISTFKDGEVTSNQEYLYLQISNPNGSTAYWITFTTVDDQSIDKLMRSTHR